MKKLVASAAILIILLTGCEVAPTVEKPLAVDKIQEKDVVRITHPALSRSVDVYFIEHNGDKIAVAVGYECVSVTQIIKSKN